MLVDGVTVEYRRKDGSIAGAQARVIDFDTPDNNDWLAVNQFTVSEGQHTRRPDVVLFVNGLPLAVIELKNPADENATVWSAFQQLQTYQAQIPALFATNAVLVASDGVQARIGSLGAGKEWFKPWRTITGREDAPGELAELQVVLEGVFEQRRFLDLLRYFIVFEDCGRRASSKKMAGYHQFHAVNVAVEETLRAAQTLGTTGAGAKRRVATTAGRPGGEPGDRRVGVVWHTQGSGKSLTMAFYAGRVILHPAMANPTIVVLTDRNDLDDQLFGTFARCRDLLRQPPVQAADRADLRAKLAVASGGVVFTTIQKFFPEEKGDRHPVLSERRNIVVIADEAHRSQYDFIDGFARHMRDALPNASFVGFTGTPIEKTDANTRAVFGDYISVYDIQRAVVDGATVPIYYESRLAKLELKESERPKIDPEFEEATEGEEVERKEKLKSKWAQLEAVVGSENRIKLIARDLVEHFENRLAAMDGKAMVVCMSRRIAVELYRELARLRPAWHGDDDDQGALKVVMTGLGVRPARLAAAHPQQGAPRSLAQRFRDPTDPFRIVIVRDMWLTGFDAPSLHTMYVDKPMRGHGLMQAIARVNRVFKDKPGGLVVDYLGLADELQAGAGDLHGGGRHGQDGARPGRGRRADAGEVRGLPRAFHGFDWSPWTDGHAAGSAVAAAGGAGAHPGPGGRQGAAAARRHRAVAGLRAGGAARGGAAHPRRRGLLPGGARGARQEHARRTQDRRGAGPRHPADHLQGDGLGRGRRHLRGGGPQEAGHLDPLGRVPGRGPRHAAAQPRRRAAAEAAQGRDQDSRSKRNVVQARSFAELLEQSVRKYQNRAIETAQVIEELIQLAKDMRAADARGEAARPHRGRAGLLRRAGDQRQRGQGARRRRLRAIARELVETVRRTSRSTGRSARTSARSCACSSSASCASTAIRRTSRRRRRRRSWSRPRCCRSCGRWHEGTLPSADSTAANELDLQCPRGDSPWLDSSPRSLVPSSSR